MHIKKPSLKIFLTLSVVALAAASHAYVIKKGENFSKIIGVNVPGPVFGKKGNFEQILKLNPQIKNPAIIYPGEKLNLGGLQPEEKPETPEFTPSQKETIKKFQYELYAKSWLQESKHISFQDQLNNCSKKLKVRELSTDFRFVELDVIQNGITLDQSFECLKIDASNFQVERTNQKNRPDPKSFLKGQTLEMTIHWEPYYKWGLHYRFENLNAASVSSIDINLKSHNILGTYSHFFTRDIESVFSLGVKSTSSSVSKNNGTDQSKTDMGLLAGVRLNYFLSPVWRPYANYETDRYLVLGNTNLLTPNYALVFKHSLSLGIKRSLLRNLNLSADAGSILPSKNSVASIQSGIQAAVQIDYSWKRVNLGYRFQKFNLKTAKYEDSGNMHSLRFGYSF